jgi:GNAT superfamily N-acetyltransferase
MQIQIEPAVSSRAIAEFISFPWKIYGEYPNWVPPLVSEQRKLLDPAKKHPFYSHASVKRYIARADGRIAGTICSIVNDTHVKFHEEKTGFFGFFECINEHDVARALLEKARADLRDAGMERIRGPMNFSTNETCGMLLDAFDKPPFVMMPYNPPYYPRLMELCGFVKAKDLLAYWMNEKTISIPDKLKRVSERIAKREGVTFRTIDMKRFDAEIGLVKEIYNAAWSRNWGFVPMTDEEFHHMAKDLKRVIDPRMVFIAEVAGKPAAFSLALPDINLALKKVKNGRLFPLGLAKLLWHGRNIHRVRVITLGVVKEFQKRGLDGLLIMETITRGMAMGYHEAEMSWVLEDNELMRHGCESIGGHVSKTYRVYEAPL